MIRIPDIIHRIYLEVQYTSTTIDQSPLGIFNICNMHGGIIQIFICYLLFIVIIKWQFYKYFNLFYVIPQPNLQCVWVCIRSSQNHFHMKLLFVAFASPNVILDQLTQFPNLHLHSHLTINGGKVMSSLQNVHTTISDGSKKFGQWGQKIVYKYFY